MAKSAPSKAFVKASANTPPAKAKGANSLANALRGAVGGGGGGGGQVAATPAFTDRGFRPQAGPPVRAGGPVPAAKQAAKEGPAIIAMGGGEPPTEPEKPEPGETNILDTQVSGLPSPVKEAPPRNIGDTSLYREPSGRAAGTLSSPVGGMSQGTPPSTPEIGSPVGWGDNTVKAREERQRKEENARRQAEFLEYHRERELNAQNRREVEAEWTASNHELSAEELASLSPRAQLIARAQTNIYHAVAQDQASGDADLSHTREVLRSLGLPEEDAATYNLGMGFYTFDMLKTVDDQIAEIGRPDITSFSDSMIENHVNLDMKDLESINAARWRLYDLADRDMQSMLDQDIFNELSPEQYSNVGQFLNMVLEAELNPTQELIDAGGFQQEDYQALLEVSGIDPTQMARVIQSKYYSALETGDGFTIGDQSFDPELFKRYLDWG